VSILVEEGDTRILVDTGPDLREQLLDAGVGDVAAVIWTHDHADHCHGIDDLRQLYHARGEPVAGYARAETVDTLRARFAYAFEGKFGYPPVATACLLPDRISIGPIEVFATDQPHGSISSAGLVFASGERSIGYATDFHDMTEGMHELYSGVDVWIVDALRRRPHPSHGHLSQVLGWIDAVQPGRAILTHMDHSMDYAGLLAELPPGVEPGYDGMEIEL
jgi:phosphoribosyl 1,2-cyclic phosphate phosphodiesterase